MTKCKCKSCRVCQVGCVGCSSAVPVSCCAGRLKVLLHTESTAWTDKEQLWPHVNPEKAARVQLVLCAIPVPLPASAVATQSSAPRLAGHWRVVTFVTQFIEDVRFWGTQGAATEDTSEVNRNIYKHQGWESFGTSRIRFESFGDFLSQFFF